MSDAGQAGRQRKKSSKPRNWKSQAERPKPYDPLALLNLGRSIELTLLEQAPVPITDVPLMIGAGVYAIYYTGEHELYQPIVWDYCRTPIYVGKAVPAGGRKGLVDDTKDTTALWDRIQEHRESLEQVSDLDVNDFMVRYLVAVEVFVSLAERVMIQQFKPVWNVVLDGFGNHDPGARRRRDGQRPPWDELHSGRWWSTPENMPNPSMITADESRRRIREHFSSAETLLDECRPDPSTVIDLG
ncbi:Eco29kI family restriction endonuclease [Streptomyces sp. NPDC085946]|uniref:Eco29kI family restriction endonuclease n=1 Tax=Streptomyces sp. NPDC085946 TaxID=3365744 RepID=UPI0037CEA933